MTSVWMSPATLERLAGSLLHFVWQGAAIAIVTAAALRLLRGRPAEWRYGVASAALAAMLLAPLVTFAFYAETGALTLSLMRGLNDVAARAASEVASGDVAVWARRIVSVWMVGVALLFVRLLGGWLLSRRLVRSATMVVTPMVTEALAHARAGLNFHAAVRVLSGPRIETPIVIGWLRPAILLPASALTGLTPDQLLAIVAHELAHVRRHDFLVNGVQRVVECVLFYHPAVWWVSGRIRLERERCCDDLAVGVCGNGLVYAQALVTIEKARTAFPALAVPTAGIGLADRVRRVLGVRGASHDWQSAAAAALFAAILVSAGAWQPPMMAGQASSAPRSAPQSQVQPPQAARTEAPEPAAPFRALAAIATAEGVRAAEPALAPQPAPAPRVVQPQITQSREAAREKLGLLRVEYSAESFIKQAAEGDTIAVKTFLAAGMNINARGEANYTALIKAAEAEQLETVQALLAAGADPNLSGGSGFNSALSAAAARGHLAMMKVLLAGGAQVDLKLFGIQDSQDETALIRAAGSGKRDAVVLLLDSKAFIDAQSATGRTALAAAVVNGQIDVARTLLDRGANVNARTTKDGFTALYTAAARRDVDLLQLLLDRGADVNARSTTGSSPLLNLLLRTGSVATAPANALLLIQRGADVNATAETGETPLGAAVSRRAVDVVRALLEKGANPNIVMKGTGGLALMPDAPPLALVLYDALYAYTGQSQQKQQGLDIALLLIERGADPNARGSRSETPLLMAVEGKQPALVRALLAKGADPNQPGRGTSTPLSVASTEEIKQMLIAAGAKP